MTTNNLPDTWQLEHDDDLGKLPKPIHPEFVNIYRDPNRIRPWGKRRHTEPTYPVTIRLEASPLRYLDELLAARTYPEYQTRSDLLRDGAYVIIEGTQTNVATPPICRHLYEHLNADWIASSNTIIEQLLESLEKTMKDLVSVRNFPALRRLFDRMVAMQPSFVTSAGISHLENLRSLIVRTSDILDTQPSADPHE